MQRKHRGAADRVLVIFASQGLSSKIPYTFFLKAVGLKCEPKQYRAETWFHHGSSEVGEASNDIHASHAILATTPFCSATVTNQSIGHCPHHLPLQGKSSQGFTNLYAGVGSLNLCIFALFPDLNRLREKACWRARKSLVTLPLIIKREGDNTCHTTVKRNYSEYEKLRRNWVYLARLCMTGPIQSPLDSIKPFPQR